MNALPPVIATLLLVAIAVIGGSLIFVFSQGFFESIPFVEPRVVRSGLDNEHLTIYHITKDECFKEYGGSWFPNGKECHTRDSTWEIAKLGDDIYLSSNSEIRQSYIDRGYTIFNSTDTDTEIGFVLDVCDDFKITASELYCLKSEPDGSE